MATLTVDMTADNQFVIPFMRSFIRLDDSPDEFRKAQNGCFWLLSNLGRIKAYFNPQDYALLTCIYQANWQSRNALDDFGQSADATTLNWDGLEALAVEDNTTAILDRLQELRDVEVGIDISAAVYRTQDDLQLAVERMARDYEANHWRQLARMINTIARGSWTDPISKKVYGGAKGARQYTYEQLEKGVLSDVGINRNQSYVLNEDTDALIKMYDEEGLCNHTIGTGLQHLDDAFQLKRGQLLGVLGAAKHRKTTLCRSIAYNAMLQGFNVLWVCIEQTAEEELAAFQVIHTHQMFPHTGVTVQKYDRHKLTAEERGELKEAGEDLAELMGAGRFKIVEPGNRSWGMIEQMIQAEALLSNLDVVVIDYLSLVQSPNKDERAGMAEIIKAAKQLGKNLDSLVITPIQGNRDGAIRAADLDKNGNPGVNEGVWDVAGIYEYSEFTKSCDCIISVWYDDLQRLEHEIIIGLLINRRAPDMMPLLARVSDDAGYIYQSYRSVREKDEIVEWAF